jgi:hypothetical protein
MLPEASLSRNIGYFEGSKSNLLSLMEEHNLLGDEIAGSICDDTIPTKLLPEMDECFRLFPKRAILNSLVEHFFRDVNWIYEMMHPTLFLGRYEKWWQCVPGSTSESLQFSILILRVCAYSAQFFPLSTQELGPPGEDTLMGVPLDKIRKHCHDLASRLQRLCDQLSGPRSLIWVQQLFYAACYEKNEGNIKDAWFILGYAIRVVQDLGLHVEDTRIVKRHMNDLEYDMGRRAFWNLYIWDRFLSLFLDRAPCIVDSHCSTDLPKMRLLNPALGAAAPDIFTERILQVRLSKFLSSLSVVTPYDPIATEEDYAKLGRSFISQLPRAFDLYAPDTQWDSKLPHLSRQRQTLRIAIYIGVCQMFQPLLSLNASHVHSMLQFERDLLVQHREHLVRSAIEVLSSVNKVHRLMGGGTHRFFMLSFCTFQPAMLLCLHLLTLNVSQQALTGDLAQSKQELLGRRPIQICTTTNATSPQTCRQHIEDALHLLRSLQYVNTIAQVGARKLEQVLMKLNVTTSPYNFTPTIPAVADGPVVQNWLGFEMQQVRDSEEIEGTVHHMSINQPADAHTQDAVDDPDGPWGERAFEQWMAEDFCADLQLHENHLSPA